MYKSGAGKAEWSLGPLEKGLEYPGEVARWVSEQLPALHWKGLILSAKVGGGGGMMVFFTQLSSPSYSGSRGKLGKVHTEGGMGECDGGMKTGGGGMG